ncbi:MAG TPA: hypothetical protein VGI82_01770 [Chitinophagaceae bacterium]
MRLVIFILLLLASSCQNSSKIPDEFDYGKIKNGLYTNDYFDFEMPVPSSWNVQNKQQVDELQKQGEDLISGNNNELKAKVKAASVQTANLLTAFKYKPQTIPGFNPSFIIVAENLGNSGVKDATIYLDHAKNIMKQSSVLYQFDPDYHSDQVGNKDFSRMDVSLSANGDVVRQSYYCRIEKNFAFSLIISYDSDVQKTELKEIINKATFK